MVNLEKNNNVLAKSDRRRKQFKKDWIALSSLSMRSIRTQYRNSFLGVLWTLLNPLLNMFVLSFVFSKIFGRQNPLLDYPVYILSGNIVFNLMRTATSTGMTSIVGQRDLINKTKLNLFIFPASKVMSALVNYGFSMLALILVMLVRVLMGAKVAFHWTLLLSIAPFLPALLAFSLGLALILSVIYVYFRDISHFYTVFLTLWMYATPLFYTLENLNLSDKELFIMRLNPMYHFVTYYRDLIMGVIPSAGANLMIYAWGLGMLAVGFLVFRAKRNKLILHL